MATRVLSGAPAGRVTECCHVSITLHHMVEHVRTVYDSPAYMKLLNAGRHFRSLETEILDWTEKNRLLAPTRLSTEEDSTCVLFRPEVPFIPELKWSCWFGDGVHNLRSALDLLTFEICRIDGEAPEHPDKIYFPVVEDEQYWQNRTRYLGSIPASLLRRIQDVQPWHSDSARTHVLALVSRLNNMDKHRTTVGLRVLPGMLEPPRIYPLAAVNEDKSLWNEPWMQLQMSGPLRPESLPALWHVDPAPMIYFENRMTFLGHLQPWLFQQVKRIFGYIVTGTWPIIDNPAPEPVWVPIPD